MSCTCASNHRSPLTAQFGASQINVENCHLSTLGTTHAPAVDVPTAAISTRADTRLALWRHKTTDTLILEKRRPFSTSASAVLAQLKSTETNQHAHIVFIHDVSNTSEATQTLSEYVAGGDLHGLQARHAASGIHISEDILLHFARQLAEAVIFLQRGPPASASTGRAWRPILHGDIKPENVALSPHPLGARYAANVKLVDFDMSLHLHERDTARGGTKLYAPPEYPRVSDRVDVWGVGATIWYLAVGRAPRIRFDKAVPSCGHPSCVRRPLPEVDAAAVQGPDGEAAAAAASSSSGATGTSVLDNDRQDTETDVAALNAAHPLCYSAHELIKRYRGWSYNGGHYTRAFARLLISALTQNPLERPDATTLLDDVNALQTPTAKAGWTIHRLKRREWLLPRPSRGQGTTQEEEEEGKSDEGAAAEEAQQREGEEEEGAEEEEEVGAPLAPLTSLSTATAASSAGAEGAPMAVQDSGYVSHGRARGQSQETDDKTKTKTKEEEKKKKGGNKGAALRVLRTGAYVALPPFFSEQWMFDDEKMYSRGWGARVGAVWGGT